MEFLLIGFLGLLGVGMMSSTQPQTTSFKPKVETRLIKQTKTTTIDQEVIQDWR